MVALLDVGVIAIAVEKKVTPTLSSAAIRVRNFKNSDQRFLLAQVEELSPVFIKLSDFDTEFFMLLDFPANLPLHLSCAFITDTSLSLLVIITRERGPYSI